MPPVIYLYFTSYPITKGGQEVLFYDVSVYKIEDNTPKVIHTLKVNKEDISYLQKIIKEELSSEFTSKNITLTLL